MTLKLYKTDVSPPVRAVYMVLHKLNIFDDVEFVDMDLFNAKDHKKEEYLKLNPQSTVPTLVDGDFVVWDSHAIIGYLVATYGKDDSLYPTNPKKRAIVDQRLHFDSGVLFPTLADNVQPIVFFGAKKFAEEGLDRVKKAYDLLEASIRTPWLAGDELTVADISVAATLGALSIFLPIEEKKYPKIAEWFQRVKKQDFYEKIVPGLQRSGQIIKNCLKSNSSK